MQKKNYQDMIEQELHENIIQKELKSLGQTEQKHLDAEFANYDRIYPKG